jgi:hypothetical protein
MEYTLRSALNTTSQLPARTNLILLTLGMGLIVWAAAWIWITIPRR